MDKLKLTKRFWRYTSRILDALREVWDIEEESLNTNTAPALYMGELEIC